MPITTTIAIPKSIKRTAFRVDNPPPFPEDGSVAIAIAPILSSPSVGRIRKGVSVTAAAGIAVCVGGIGVSVGTGVWVSVGAFESASVSILGINKNSATTNRTRIKNWRKPENR